MTVTQTYTQIHDAFLEAAHHAKMTPYEVRVLVAVHEEEGPTRSDVLADRLGLRTVRNEAICRRALLTLYGRGYATGEPRTPGTRTTVTLTEKGRVLAEGVLVRLQTVQVAA